MLRNGLVTRGRLSTGAGDIVHGLLSNDIAVAISACDHFLVVGTQSGAAHIVSPAGALIRSTSQLHSAPVTSIAIDDAMQVSSISVIK